MVEHISISTAEAAILSESALDSDGFAHLRRPYNGVWVGDIKMFRSLEQRDLMQFVDYQEVLPAKDRVRRSRITDAGRAALAELTSQTVDAATSLGSNRHLSSPKIPSVEISPVRWNHAFRFPSRLCQRRARDGWYPFIVAAASLRSHLRG
jgi:hypothetical protein